MRDSGREGGSELKIKTTVGRRAGEATTVGQVGYE